jgi:protoheme IX farnesyltransferase
MAVLTRLFKVRIAALAGFSSATGYVLAGNGASPGLPAAGGASLGLLAPSLGVFLIACGSCALNQIQERRIDSLMRRTSRRPIPSRRMSVKAALVAALGLTATGSLLLLLEAPVLSFALAAFAAVWYNGVYTHLKRVTMFAAVPGGLIGALPPAVGWTAAGGALADPEILSLMVFMFVWQVPHFWLLLLRYREDYDRAGLPAVTRLFSPGQLKRIIFVWIVAAAVSPMLIAMSGGSGSVLPLFLLAGMALWLVRQASRHGSRAEAAVSTGSLYATLNAHAVLVLAVLSAGSVLKI